MQRGIDIFEGFLTSAVGTFETCRPAVTMSASWGRSEVVGGGSNRRDDPKRTVTATH